MLFALHIRNIALIDDLEIEFHNGLNVLTGETGAGKSILIGSINLLLGERANREFIRHGDDRAEVSGVFYVESPMQKQALEELGVSPDEDGAVMLSRQLLRDGKNLCRIAGRTATLSELKQTGELLVNIHGQHDNQALLNPASHIHFLDGFLKEDGNVALRDYQTAYRAWKEFLNASEAFDIDEAEKLRKIDMLTYECNEIRAAALSPDEEDELKSKRDIINNKKRLEDGVLHALSALSCDDSGTDARQALAIAASSLSNVAMLDPSLDDISVQIESLAEEADSIARYLRNYYEQLSEDEQSVDDIESRLDVIYRLKRKYGGTVEAVIKHGEACETELDQLRNADAQKEQLLKKLSEAEQKARSLAAKLSSMRMQAISEICEEINETLHFLNMPDADFSISLTPCDLHLFGGETVQFFIKTNAGEDARPLHKVISGGELSRIMLAIKSVLTDGDAADTLIFDEIDTGVSGSAAQKIGRKLSDLSAHKQVLCVTHLAQIAAMANAHFLIDKVTENGRTKTVISDLSHRMRVQELARIISGDAVSDTTLKQAEELIEFGKAHH